MGPLHGLKIVELAGIGPGPFAAMLLADLGATVLRIERTEPADLGIPRPAHLNPLLRNRERLALDLKQPQAVRQVLQLLETADGWRVRSRKAIFATGCNIPPFVPRRPIRLASTFAFATSPLASFDGWGEDRSLLWETARPYVYARTTRDGRAIMGGADQPFKGSSKVERSRDKQTDKLAGQFAEMFPGIRFDVDWSWSGTFAETADGLPYIGAAPEFPNGYVALGYGANGITFAHVAASLLLDLFLGRGNPDADLFRIGR